MSDIYVWERLDAENVLGILLSTDFDRTVSEESKLQI